jgi:hypothetical protein
VELGRSGAKLQRAQTRDVSKHGLYITTADAPPERYLAQLSVHLPDGPMPATAYVSRREQNMGAGFELFALSARSKERWDAFIASLEGKKRAEPESDQPPERATFMVRLHSLRRLQEFYEKNVVSGGLYMATPLIKEAGAEIALAVIHPLTEQELILIARVEAVCRETPKGMELVFVDQSETSKARFLEFVQSGFAPALPEPKKKRTGYFEGSGDISIDIVVDEAAVEESASFEWANVSQDLVLDFDIADATPGAQALAGDDRYLLDLRCTKCARAIAALRMGSAEGALASVAEHRLFECTKCGALKSALRLKPIEERRRIAEAIDTEQPARVADLLALAELSAVPQCNQCLHNLKSTRAAKLAERSATVLELGDTAEIHELTCPHCQATTLAATKLPAD